MDFTLYESGTTRSARCRWTLLEAGIDFKSISVPKLIGSDELREIHPLAKLPVAVINGSFLQFLIGYRYDRDGSLCFSRNSFGTRLLG